MLRENAQEVENIQKTYIPFNYFKPGVQSLAVVSAWYFQGCYLCSWRSGLDVNCKVMPWGTQTLFGACVFKYLVIHYSSRKRPLGTNNEPCKMLGYDDDTRVDRVVAIEKYRQLKAVLLGTSRCWSLRSIKYWVPSLFVARTHQLLKASMSSPASKLHRAPGPGLVSQFHCVSLTG